MRRVLVGVYVALALVLTGLTAGPASAEPTSIVVWSSGSTQVNGDPVTVAVSLDESVDGVVWGWDLNDDGQIAYDDVADPSAQLVTWDPTEHGATTAGTYSLYVRAVVPGIPDPITKAIPITVAAISEPPTTFQAHFPTLGSMRVGDEVALRPDILNAPSNDLTYAWDIDADGQFDDSSQGWIIFAPKDVGTYTFAIQIRDQAQPDSPLVASTSIAAVPALAPVAIAGTARVGQLLTIAGGAVSPSGANRSFQWLRDGVAIPGADQSTYRVTTPDAGRRLAVRVDAAKSGFKAAPVTSVTRAIAAQNLVRPTFTGTTRVGRRLTGYPGTWAGPGYVRSYRWLRDGRPITGATTRTYVTRTTDVGHRISFRVTLSRSGFPTVVATSVSRTISR